MGHVRRHTVRILIVAAWITPALWQNICSGADAVPSRSSHWAFQRVQKPPVPVVKQSEWPRTPIDNFILAKLEQRDIVPSPQADATTLLRRVTLDLTGLPPTPAEVNQFIAEPSYEAYKQVVERLLASPHYGERWARHWLDVARYADSAGYESDFKREIWRYRDWVINAFNDDKPYDAFLTEQLAGDLMQPASDDKLIATGFNCNALKQANDSEETTVDRLDTFGTAYLGLTVGCARCHDHKFDPISRTEFCQLYAFFNQADDTEHDFSSSEKASERSAIKQQLAQLKREKAAFQAGPDVDPVVWAARLTNDELSGMPMDVRMAIGTLSDARTAEQKEMIHTAHSQAISQFRQSLKNRVDDWARQLPADRRKAFADDARTYLEIAAEKRPEEVPPSLVNEFWKQDSSLRKRDEVIGEIQAMMPETVRTLVMSQRSLVPVTFEKLDPKSGRPVQPDVPSALPPLHVEGRTANRLDLAQWATSPNNPLTARVAVNRIWQHYFGAGIVESSDNFGTQASPPSHPELLDWLAAEFMESGWSVKHIQRLIVNSATYLQSSKIRADLDETDPQNQLLARQNRLRLEAEIIRDGALASSNLLDRRIGGPSVFPAQPEGIMAGRADGTQWTASSGSDRYRRGMYTHFWRLTPHPYLRLFDAPDATESCTRRPRSNTSLQALTLLNDPWFLESAVALAARTVMELPTAADKARGDWMFCVCLGRHPAPEEEQALMDLLSAQRASFEQAPERAIALVGAAVNKDEAPNRAAWTSVARTLLNLDEFITRE